MSARRQPSPGRVVIAAGGTGGHVFPARALARQLREDGFALAFVTDRRGAHFGDDLADVACHMVASRGIAGRGLRGMAGGALSIARGTVQAWFLMRRLAPDVVVGFGSYASVPPLIAAGRLGVPTVIHEANAILGRANRLLAHTVDQIATAFETTAAVPARQRHKLCAVGNPVRAEIIAARDVPYTPADNDGRMRILVTGGSQGATILGRTVPAALARLDEQLRRRLFVSQQCRGEDLEPARETYRSAGIACDVAPFFDDIADRLTTAQLVVSRSGASTMAELCVVGRPALLVPFARAIDDHQTANARVFADAGAGWLTPEADLMPDGLADQLGRVLGDSQSLVTAAQHARAIGRTDAATRLAAMVAGLADNGNDRGGYQEAA